MIVFRNLGLLNLLFLAWCLTCITAYGEIHLPAIFGDHMVLQQQQKNPVWGTTDPGESITVTFADQTHSTQADDQGKWKVVLDEVPAGGPYTLTIKGTSTIEFKDVLVGEVWLCSGQSNMEWPVSVAKDADAELLAANHPQIRLITVPHNGTQTPQTDFDGKWAVCDPKSVANFSAIGYYFGRQLNKTLNVPVGLIDNSWGGSACDAWIRRDRLENDERYAELMKTWKERETTFNYDEVTKKFEAALSDWEASGKQGPPPQRPGDILRGNQRPANIYNGGLHPLIGYGIRGVIWYQGETNASRAYQYRDMFPLMITSWREEWNQGDFPFYWVQLADFMDESPEPSESEWAELREAQTMALSLPHTGQALALNLGEGHDIHPTNKQDVAMRLARLALANDYGKKIAYKSPRYKSMEIQGNKVVVTFDVGDLPQDALDLSDFQRVTGFAIAGADKKFVWADANITGPNTVEVWNDQVAEPVAVRYAWGNNPRCNLQSRAELPAVPFRTDDWPGRTANKLAP